MPLDDSETPTNSPTSFEQSLKELESIIQDLEKGERPLEMQLKAFERGVALSRTCLAHLEAVEKRVEILVQGGDGQFQTAPFESSGTPA